MRQSHWTLVKSVFCFQLVHSRCLWAGFSKGMCRVEASVVFNVNTTVRLCRRDRRQQQRRGQREWLPFSSTRTGVCRFCLNLWWFRLRQLAAMATTETTPTKTMHELIILISELPELYTSSPAAKILINKNGLGAILASKIDYPVWAKTQYS